MELGTLRIQSLFRVRGSRRVDTAHENIVGTGHNGYIERHIPHVSE